MDFTIEDAFLKCYEILEIQLPKLFESSKPRGIDDRVVMQAIMEAESKEGAMVLLRDAGLSLEDIGTALGLTRERIRQIAGSQDRAQRFVGELPPIETLKLAIWKEAINDMSWWGQGGRLSRDKRIKYLRQNGYSEREAKRLCSRLDGPMAEIILTASFGIPKEQHKEWINQQRYRGKLQNEIWGVVNSHQRLKMSIMTWNRYCKSLGIHESHTNAPFHSAASNYVPINIYYAGKKANLPDQPE